MKEGDCINTFYLLSLIKKYDVKVVAYENGTITVNIATWNKYKHIFQSLINDLTKERHIYSITVNGSVVTIRYNKDVIKDDLAIERLYKLIHKYQL